MVQGSGPVSETQWPVFCGKVHYRRTRSSFWILISETLVFTREEKRVHFSLLVAILKIFLATSPILMLLSAGKSGWCSSSSPDKPVLTELMQWSVPGRTRSSMLMQHMMQFLPLCRRERGAAGSPWGLWLPKWLCRPHPSEQGIDWKGLTKNGMLCGKWKLWGLN